MRSQPLGIAHGSSIENSACGTLSTVIGIIRRSGRGIPHAMPQRPETMVDLELDDLKREFLAEADEKVREIQAKLDGEQSPETLQRLTYLAHQRKGSGESYGFQRISTDAAELESAVESLSAEGSRPGIDDRIQQHEFNLRAEVDKRMREFAVESTA